MSLPLLRFLLPLLAMLLLAAACGYDDETPPADSPTPNPQNRAADWHVQYMQLRDARQLLADLGLDGVSLASEAYECIQFECPDDAPGDESWGCLSVLPIGDPANAESLYPDDPPRWYSAGWRGAFGETYAAPPEPVVNEPTTELEPRKDIACGAGFALETTAADAMTFLADAGLTGEWRHQADPAPTCAPDTDCPIPGIAAETTGCLGVSVFEQPTRSGTTEPRVTAYVNWFSGGGDQYPDGIYLNYSLSLTLAKFDAVVAFMDDRGCLESPAPTSNPYDWVPYTDSIQPTYWHLKSASGTTLVLQVAAGGGCDQFERVDVVETDESVTINGFLRHTTPGPNSGCDDSLKYHEATVELDEPLGDRELLGCAPEEIWYLDHDVDCAEPGPF